MRKLFLTGVAVPLILAGCANVETTPTLAETLETGGALKPEQQHLNLEKANLFFDIRPENREVKGKTELVLSVSEKQSNFLLNFDNNYQISEFSINNHETTNYTHRNGEIRFTLEQPLTVGEELKVAIEYKGQPHVAVNPPWDGGYVWDETETGKPWIATAVQGEGCDLIWPCIDHPKFEAGQTDIVVRVPKGLVAASNGRLVESSEGDDWSQYHWRSEQPQNNYGIALNVGPYEVLRDTYHSRYGHEYPLVFYYLEGKKDKAKKLFDEFSKQLDFYEDVIGPYPFYKEKMGVVETPHLGMEHQTINAYGQEYKAGKYNFDWLLHHELAHEWFGNQVTNTDWDHMWLHEGFGAYMQPLYGQYLHGDFAYHGMMYETRIGLRNEHPVVSNKPMSEDDVYKEDRGPGSDIYQKGAWILHTLRHLIGDDDFFAATRKLVYQTTNPKPGNFEPHFADTQYFIDAINEQTGKDYTWFFKHYLYTAALPELVAEREGNQLRLHWKTFNEAPFELPVEVKVGDSIVTVVVGKTPVQVELPTARTHYILDPLHKILKQADYLDEYAKEQREQE
ncbi:M1 family metallopeptidase [Idiomarina sp. HP20-50]|uniref:M1 family metallopeptidase n=1 Tax=Idiomarina sp. HP20-50 TaxID=3070813 RepID=UPI00294B1AF7|nr:M1 family metallopeptidase [Idiomarina sp. HP20-50]MDV6316771.1 M1 family metallopeptidase [Idiomarina sp. HP20-50]